MSTIYRKILSQFVNSDVMYLSQVTIKTKDDNFVSKNKKEQSGKRDEVLSSEKGLSCLALLTQTCIIF